MHRGRLVTSRHASVDTLDEFVARAGIERLNLIKIDAHELEGMIPDGSSINVIMRAQKNSSLPQ
jgi:hypothetical protein